MDFFNIDHIFFSALDYPMSYIEFFGVISGLIAIWLSAKANIWSWPVGIINVVLSFFLYYQIQLYPDMFLQVFFFVTNILGWWRWANPKAGEEDYKQELRVSYMQWKQFLLICVISSAGTIMLGVLASHLHEWLPAIFSKPSAFPYIDSFITVMSIVTTFFMIQKKIESWIIWIIVDMIAACLYFIKGVKFYSVEYFVFTLLAAFGLWNWIYEYKNYQTKRT